MGPPQAARLPGDVVKLSLRVFGLSRFLLIRFGFGSYTVDVLYVVVDTTALVLGGGLATGRQRQGSAPDTGTFAEQVCVPVLQ